MAKSLVSVLLVSASLALAACATGTTPAPKAQVGAAEKSQKPIGADEVLSRIYELPPQHLEKGECGMFLWFRRADAPLIYFQKANSNTAQMVIDGTPVSLNRTSAETPVLSVFFEKQRFDAGGFEINLTVSAERDPNIRGGLKVSAGTLSLKADDGWSAALPIAGVIGCQETVNKLS